MFLINPSRYLLLAPPSMTATTTTTFWTVLMLLTLLTTLQASCPIFLTISLDGKSVEDSFLEINWGPYCNWNPEWIGIFLDNPSVSNTEPLAKFYGIRTQSGRLKTNVKVGKLKFPKGWGHDDINTLPTEYPRGTCLNYFVASFNRTEMLTVECLKIQPNWMDKVEHVATMQLKNLLIPGTHASGAFSALQKSNLVKNYAFSQHMDVWSQLVFGIRFIDISVGVDLKKSRVPLDNDNFWVVNENMLVTKLSPILKDIRRFVEISREVVIVDFSSFPIGFYKRPDRHSDLLRLIEREIGDVAYRRHNTSSSFKCYNLSVDKIRSTGKQVIVLYPMAELPYPDSESDILCPTWKTFTLNTMRTVMTRYRLMLSGNPDYIVAGEGWICIAVNGLEEVLNVNNRPETTVERAGYLDPNLALWLGGPWGSEVNVVAVDFFTNTNLVDLAIYINMQKAFFETHKDLLRLEIHH